MEFVYKELMAILSVKHAINDDGQTAFRGRLQHMQRLGFPSGVNTGKGKPASYTWKELLLLGLAFEYLEIGSPPDRCVTEILKFEDMLVAAFVEVISNDGSIDQTDQLKCFLFPQLSALLTLKSQDSWEQQCNIMSLNEIHQILSEQGLDAHRSPYAIIDLRQLVGGLVSSVIAVCKLDSSIVAKDIKLWAARAEPLPS